ncbi:hypothetical protein [Pseudonocardia sp. WMMC193]|uniref:hypothetical protein n=1 Tax=Pseudonocardia sp. WMMC193 TaxID=2911965 RepID=UPI001F41ABC7|nr:hypothetical protein [Pseudonocardia sp. WMMC193]MCF7550693.1 hypothetical protein [Pseudonocardia sp. WMMC193]
MSSTMNPPAARPALIPRVITALFVVTVVFFLLAGLTIVLGQTATLIGGNADAARAWATALKPYAFGGASAAGLLSFALIYWHGEQHDGAGDDTDDDTDDTDAEERRK